MITVSFTDEGKSCLSPEFLMSQICLLTLFPKIKFFLKFPNLLYLNMHMQISILAMTYNVILEAGTNIYYFLSTFSIFISALPLYFSL